MEAAFCVRSLVPFSVIPHRFYDQWRRRNRFDAALDCARSLLNQWIVVVTMVRDHYTHIDAYQGWQRIDVMLPFRTVRPTSRCSDQHRMIPRSDHHMVLVSILVLISTQSCNHGWWLMVDGGTEMYTFMCFPLTQYDACAFIKQGNLTSGQSARDPIGTRRYRNGSYSGHSL